MMQNLILECVEYLNIRCRYSIELDNRPDKDCRAYWEARLRQGRFTRHYIRVYLGDIRGDIRNLETLIAHEFIHAWQFENEINEGAHGLFFQETANDLEKHLNSCGFKMVRGIYRQDVDE